MMNKTPLCKIRDIYRAITSFESQIISDYGLSLNEGMLLCCLSEKGIVSSTDIANNLGMTCSNTSKVIKSVESKKLIQRSLNEEDKRSMLFSLTEEGKKKLAELMSCQFDLSAALKDLF